MKKLLFLGAAVLAGTIAFSQIGTNTKHGRKKPATMAADEKEGGSGVDGRTVDSGYGSGRNGKKAKNRHRVSKNAHGRDGKTDTVNEGGNGVK